MEPSTVLFKLSVVIGTKQNRRQLIREIDFYIYLISDISLKGFFLLTSISYNWQGKTRLPLVTEHHYILSKDFPFKISKIMAAQAFLVVYPQKRITNVLLVLSNIYFDGLINMLVRKPKKLNSAYGTGYCNFLGLFLISPRR